MLNTSPTPAPSGALPDSPQPDFGKIFGEFARFMEVEQFNPIQTMNDTTKKVMLAVALLSANTPETKEALAIVERLAQYHLGYQKVQYEWLGSTKSHCFCVEFSGRLPIVAIHPDLCTAIVLINQRIMSAFSKPETDLTGTEQSPLECLEVLPNNDRRTPFVAA